MTVQEAVKIIKRERDSMRRLVDDCNLPITGGHEYIEAYDMAIEALKAQPESSTEIQEILEYLDTTLHPIVSPDNWYVYAELHDMVSMLPSAQLERETGKWMLDNNNYYEERYICSQCGANYKVDTCMGKPAWSFCPNCGADMRGESDE